MELTQAGLCHVLEDGEEDGEVEEEEVGEQSPRPGSFVGLVEEGSTLCKPRVLLGRVSIYPSRNEASLHLSKAVYVLELNGK